jgi:hypothetical protein
LPKNINLLPLLVVIVTIKVRSLPAWSVAQHLTGSMALFGAGFLGIGVIRRRKSA